MSKSAELHTDASESSIRAVILQRDESHINRPIAFISRNYQIEKNATVPQRERH